jgi:hypothetical protein
VIVRDVTQVTQPSNAFVEAEGYVQAIGESSVVDEVARGVGLFDRRDDGDPLD